MSRLFSRRLRSASSSASVSIEVEFLHDYVNADVDGTYRSGCDSTWDSPAEGDSFEVSTVSLFEQDIKRKSAKPLDVPKWLEEAIGDYVAEKHADDLAAKAREYADDDCPY